MRTMLPGLVAVALLAAACASDDLDTNRTSQAGRGEGTAATTLAADTAMAKPAGGELVELEAFIDGDSLAVIRDGRRSEVRLAGINTPEAGECFGDAARTLLASLATDQVVLLPVAGDDDVDQYGRLLRNVWVGDTWVNLEMVRQGAAVALQTGSDDEAALVAAEDAAWQSGRGLWADTACGGFIAGVRITDLRFDPPGRDFENAAEEFVLLANEGDTTVDMSGWIVRDESSTHRYEFAAGFTLAPGDGIRLRSGCGEDGGRDLYWCAGDAVWSNGGDTVIVQTAAGTVVDRWKYAGEF